MAKQAKLLDTVAENKKGLYVVIGIAVLLAAAFFVSNKRIQVSLLRSRANSTGTIISGAVVAPNGSKEIINPKIVSETFTDIENKFYQDPTQFLNPDQKARIEPQLNQYIAVPKTSSATAARNISRLGALKARDVRQVDYPKAQSLSFKLEKDQSLQEVQVALPDSDIIQDRIAYVKQAGVDSSLDSTDSTDSTTTPVATSMAASAKPVTVGVVDTGVDGVAGANYAPGPETTRWLTFFEPWQTAHSFPIQVPASGGWLNVTASWNVFFGLLQSPADLDLVVKDQNGNIVGTSNNVGNIPASERVEIYLKPQSGARTYTAEVSVKNSSPRIAWEDFKIWSVKFPFPAFTVGVEASLDPETLDLALNRTFPAKPKGALDSYNKHWKGGVISLHGEKYNFIASDVYPDQICSQYQDPTYDFKYYILYGYDGISIDLNGDGDYSDITGVGSCVNKFYQTPSIVLDGVPYSLNFNYSNYEIDTVNSGGKKITQRLSYLSDLNDKIMGFERYFGVSVYGPKDTTQDFIGHGTHVAGIIKSQAPNAKIYNAKVFGNGPGFGFCFSQGGSSELDPNAWTLCGQGIGAYESDIINGIEGAVSQGAKVINLSLGGYYLPPSQCSDFLLPQYLKDLINKRGITVVVAAGNEGPGQGIESPGCLSEAITVGAVGATNNNVTNYSSRGPSYEGLDKPDLVAVGGDDPSLNIQKNVAFIFPGGVVSNESSKLWSLFGIADKAGANQIKLSGTSMAAPQVAGAAAVLIGTKSALSPIQIKSLLMDSATDLGQPKEAQGVGLLNLSRALSLLKPKISAIKPSSGEVDTKAAILGSGFAKTNTIKFGKGYITNVGSQDGLSLNFQIPKSVSPCLTGPVGCSQPDIIVLPGTYPISVLNGYATSNQLNFTVMPLPTPKLSAVTVTSPNGGEGWVKGFLYKITWQRNFLPKGSKGLVDIFIRRGNQPNKQIGQNVPDNWFQWRVLESYAVAKDYKITVTSDGFGDNLSDASDNYFQIIPSSSSVSTFLLPQDSSIAMLSPSMSSLLYSDSDYAIKYKITGYEPDTKLNLILLLVKNNQVLGTIHADRHMTVLGDSNEFNWSAGKYYDWNTNQLNQISGTGFKIRAILYYGGLQVGTDDTPTFSILPSL